MRQDVERAVRHGARPERVLVTAELDEVDLVDVRIGVAPLSVDEGHPVLGLQVDHGIRSPGQELGRARQPRCGCQGRGRHDQASTFTTK